MLRLFLKDTTPTKMAEILIENKVDGDIVQLHPAFFIVGEELGEVILSTDGTTVLACSQPLAKVGEGSTKFTSVFFKKLDDRQMHLTL